MKKDGVTVKRSHISVLLFALMLVSTATALAAEPVVLSLGKAYTVTALEPVASYEEIATRDYPDPGNTKLTDGKFAEEVKFDDPGFVGYLRQAGRDIVIDLGREANISEIKVRLFNDPDVGIYHPRSASVSFSDDGKLWSTPIVKNLQETLEAEVTTVTFKTEAIGRYVKVYFPVDVWVFTDEITVSGFWAE